jgi:hypothetical protein
MTPILVFGQFRDEAQLFAATSDGERYRHYRGDHHHDQDQGSSLRNVNVCGYVATHSRRLPFGRYGASVLLGGLTCRVISVATISVMRSVSGGRFVSWSRRVMRIWRAMVSGWGSGVCLRWSL